MLRTRSTNARAITAKSAIGLAAAIALTFASAAPVSASDLRSGDKWCTSLIRSSSTSSGTGSPWVGHHLTQDVTWYTYGFHTNIFSAYSGHWIQGTSGTFSTYGVSCSGIV